MLSHNILKNLAAPDQDFYYQYHRFQIAISAAPQNGTESEPKVRKRRRNFGCIVLPNNIVVSPHAVQ